MGTAAVSRREADVLAALGERLSNAEIAARLFISVRTVETHVSALLRKFDVRTRRDLALIARARPAEGTVGAQRRRLPPRLTSFLGREAIFGELHAMLSASRLVTVTGAGGVGKTRLAIEMAAVAAAQYPGGAWFVDLTRARDPAGFMDSVASVLAVEDQPGAALRESVVRLLERSPPMLLLLDNCEHVISSAAQFVLDVLTVTDTVVLATSRERLGIPGEQVFPLRPLEMAAAVQLFADRASALDPAFSLHTDDRPPGDRGEEAVASICRRLDGLPLAIELAAAQITTLTPRQIDARLADRFATLRGPVWGGPARHETLSAALGWSYDLLEPAERELLDRLTVFRGRFSAEAAARVAAGAPLEDVAGDLAQLVRKSLVVTEDVADERRFRLLESVREYGWRRLEASGQANRWRDRHLDWVVDLLADAGRWVSSDRQSWWFDVLDEELPNIDAAMEWSASDPLVASRVLPALQGLRRYWLAWGMRRAYQGGAELGAPLRPRTGARWLEVTAVAATAAGPAAQARSLVDAVNLLTLVDLTAAARLAATAREVAGADEEARSYAALAAAFVDVFGHAPGAGAVAAWSASAFAEDDVLHWWAQALLALRVGRTGRFADAAAALHVVSAGFEALGDNHLAGGWRGWAADLSLAAGDQRAARRDHERAEASARRYGCASCESQVLCNRVLLEPGADAATRRDWAREGVRLSHAIAEPWSVLCALEVTVAAWATSGMAAEAALLAAAVEELRRSTGYAAVLPSRAHAHRAGTAAARELLGPDAAAALERDGAALDYDEAVALALS